ncbi:WhiB family transcriptional regulator [Sanguibacter sp. 25GB23B1]|uniref:WhiB family transcriptional regulator n=1 Tax=unclassified Sanguibacter TaxID=2645534 RepID=UPI0032AF232B
MSTTVHTLSRRSAAGTSLPRSNAWRDDAICRGLDPELFDAVNRHDGERAKAVCARCPVRRECLLDALTEEATDTFGPWLVRGGMTKTQRRDLPASERRTLVADLTESIRASPRPGDSR